MARRIRNLAISDALLEETLSTQYWKRAETEKEKKNKDGKKNREQENAFVEPWGRG